MKIKLFLKLFIFLSLIVPHKDAFCYDNKMSHQEISEYSVKISIADEYLKTTLGYLDGIETFLPFGSSDTVWQRIRQGSFLEDSPECRPANHFHDPLKDWSSSGLTDNRWPQASCNIIIGWPGNDRHSNIVWATGFTQPPPDGVKESYYGEQIIPYDWDMARSYYYDSLTGSSGSLREARLGTTFEVLGHVLHLLQDVSVPAHVRNDFSSHLVWDVASFSFPANWWIQLYEHYVKTHPELVDEIGVPLLNKTTQPVTPNFQNTRLTDFWDTTHYRENPDMPPEANSLTSGLAETTNANYFSISTIPTTTINDIHKYDFPKLTTGTHQLCNEYIPEHIHPGQGPTNFHRKYISREPCPDIDPLSTVDKYVAVSLLNAADIGDDSISSIRISLDQNVYETYARELLPRAIGYSAALLDYFFRGKIDFVNNPEGEGFLIKNLSNEDIVGGGFSAYFDDETGSRTQLPGAVWQNVSIPANESYLVNYTWPTEIQADKYMLVFRGQLGNELNAVSGAVVNPCNDSFQWDPANPQEFTTNSLDLHVNGCTGPYNWSVAEPGFTLEPSVDDPTGSTYTLIAEPDACGSATITVTDSSDPSQETVTGTVRTKNGRWITLSQPPHIQVPSYIPLTYRGWQGYPGCTGGWSVYYGKHFIIEEFQTSCGQGNMYGNVPCAERIYSRSGEDEHWPLYLFESASDFCQRVIGSSYTAADCPICPQCCENASGDSSVCWRVARLVVQEWGCPYQP